MQILLVIDVQQRYLKNYKPDLVNRVNARIREAMSKEAVLYGSKCRL